MPVYTYACGACSQEIERRQSYSDAPLTTCESCGGVLRRVLHPVGVIFKGSGFYNTDYRKSGNGTSTGDKKDGAPETKSDSSKKSESKGDSSSSPSSSSEASSSASSTSTTPSAAPS